ncbi:MAG: hypothetical protein HOI23_12210 [Deltaproteobacteria bacterium]|nr:hypothetical protein [Deltaproteobacteria bacterium]
MPYSASWLFTYTLIIAMLTSGNTLADAGPKVGARVWTKLTADLQAEKEEPSFDVYRGFLTADFVADEQWSAHIIIDAQTTKAALGAINTGSGVSLFQAMVRGKSLILKDDVLLVGLSPGHYLVPLYKKLKTRHLGKTLSHHQGNFGARQLGVSYLLNFSGVRMGLHAHEADRTHGKKSDHNLGVSTTIGYDFTEHIGVMASHSFAQGDDSTSASQHATALALYTSNPDYRVALELSFKKINDLDATPFGYGMTANIKIWEKLRLFTRVFTGNQAYQADVGGLLVWSVGPTLNITKGVSIGAVFDSTEALEGADPTRTVSLVLTANL